MFIIVHSKLPFIFAFLVFFRLNFRSLLAYYYNYSSNLCLSISIFKFIYYYIFLSLHAQFACHFNQKTKTKSIKPKFALYICNIIIIPCICMYNFIMPIGLNLRQQRQTNDIPYTQQIKYCIESIEQYNYRKTLHAIEMSHLFQLWVWCFGRGHLFYEKDVWNRSFLMFIAYSMWSLCILKWFTSLYVDIIVVLNVWIVSIYLCNVCILFCIYLSISMYFFCSLQDNTEITLIYYNFFVLNIIYSKVLWWSYSCSSNVLK